MESLPHRVVVVGGGFGGLYAAKALGKGPVSVTLVDRRNFHLFQPLLYQVATGALSPANIAAPLRSILKRRKNTEVLLGEVIDVDVKAPRVRLKVEVSLSALVTDIADGRVTAKRPEGSSVIESRTVLWAAGVAASPLGAVLARATGAATDRAGRIRVQPDLTLPGHPEI